MKKITLLFLFCLTAMQWSYSQCTNPVYQYPPAAVTITPTPGPQTIVANNWPQNEFSVVNGLVPGESYTITATPDMADPDYTPGAMTYITATSDGTTVLVHGFDSVSFVATTAEITIYWTLDAACGDGPNLDTLTEIECTTCICTATAVPDSINPTPADGDTTVQIVPDGADLVITPFEWEEAIAGNEGEYTISLGITNAGDDIGTIPFNGGGIIFTWTENTQYWWYITGTNCIGTAQSAIWTFTTAACTETAAPGCTNLLLPADNDPDVGTVEAANMTREVNLSWDALPGAIAYRITFDGNDLGNTADTDIDIFGLDYDTMYTWSIAPVNCFGVTAGCVTRTFTTEQDPNLSISEFDTKSISVYPNPVKDVLNIKTDLALESIEVINILGKRVLTISGDQMTNNTVNLSELRDGIYFVNISADGKKQTIKVVKE